MYNPIPHNGKEYWPDANGWYDMECAPKDGTRVLLFGIERGFLPERAFIGFFDYNLTIGSHPVWRNYSGDNFRCIPTKWQPIPPPPKE